MTAPSGELGPTQTSTGDTCNPTSTGSRSSSTSGGFKVSTTKTVAVEFSRNGTPPAHLPLKLGTSRLLYQSSVKFLEVIFDRHLTWSEHIQYVADRCRKRLNLMCAMAGSLGGLERHPPDGLPCSHPLRHRLRLHRLPESLNEPEERAYNKLLKNTHHNFYNPSG